MCCCCPLAPPCCPLPPPTRPASDLRRESFAGSAGWLAAMSAIVGAESRRRHSSSSLAAAFAFVRIRFASFRRSFQFSFCLNKKILNLIFLRVSCSLTISESLSRMRVADFALLFTLTRLCRLRFVVIILVRSECMPTQCVSVCVCVRGLIPFQPQPPPTRSCHSARSPTRVRKFVNNVVHYRILSIVA